MKLFLAAPFTDRLADAGLGLQPEYRHWLESVIRVLEGRGHEVLSAHRKERWGHAVDPPDIALTRDFEWIRASDLVIAYVGDPPSPGVQMELGYAAAFEKPVLVFRTDTRVPYLIDGLHSVTRAHILTIASRDEIAVALLSIDLQKISQI